MNDFALILFKGDCRKPAGGRNFLGRLASWVKGMFMKTALEDGISTVPLYDDLNIHLIKLPYYLNKAARHIGRLNKFISRFVMEKNIRYCFLPEKVPDSFQINGCIKFAFSGILLYKSLLKCILDKIYTDRGIQISELDIAIVEGSDFSELYEIVRLISPYVKFVTIITRNKGQVEEEMSKVYADTGLSIRVTEDIKSGLRNADLVVNTGALADLASIAKPRAEAVILNFVPEDADKITCGNVLINGITVEMPEKIASKIDSQVFEYYNKLGFIETVLFFKTNIEDRLLERRIAQKTARILSEEFEAGGYAIKEFIGRRNFLKPEDIRI